MTTVRKSGNGTIADYLLISLSDWQRTNKVMYVYIFLFMKHGNISKTTYSHESYWWWTFHLHLHSHPSDLCLIFIMKKNPLHYAYLKVVVEVWLEFIYYFFSWQVQRYSVSNHPCVLSTYRVLSNINLLHNCETTIQIKRL